MKHLHYPCLMGIYPKVDVFRETFCSKVLTIIIILKSFVSNFLQITQNNFETNNLGHQVDNNVIILFQ